MQHTRYSASCFKAVEDHTSTFTNFPNQPECTWGQPFTVVMAGDMTMEPPGEAMSANKAEKPSLDGSGSGSVGVGGTSGLGVGGSKGVGGTTGMPAHSEELVQPMSTIITIHYNFMPSVTVGPSRTLHSQYF